MMYDEKIECYKRGAANPSDVQLALNAMDDFILRFNEAYHNATPPSPQSREIYHELADDYTFEFFRRQ